MACAHGGTVELHRASALQDAVDDGGGQIVVVKDRSPLPGVFVGGEDHRAALQVAVVDDVEEHVGSVGSVGQVTDLIDDQDRRVSVAREGLGESAGTEGGGQLVDQLRGSDEQGIEAGLDCAISDGDRQVGLAASWLADEDQGATLGDEVGREGGSQQGQSHRGLETEVKLLDGLEERVPGAACQSLDAGLIPMGDLLGDQHREKGTVGPLLALGSLDERSIDPTCIGEVQPLQHRLQIDVRGRRIHGVTPEAASSGVAAR